MTRSAVGALLLVALLVIAGCQGIYGPSTASSDQHAVEAVNRAHEAAQDVTSYGFTIDGQVQMRENSRTESVEITGDGVVNVERQRVNVTVRGSGDTAVGVRDTRMAYLEGYILHKECSRLGWARENLTESTQWFNYTPVGQQLALLDRATVYWNGTETLDGVETAVVTAHPTEQQLQANQELPTGTVRTEGNAEFQNATVRVWIDTETDRIRKVHREIHVQGDEATAVATITFHFSEYDEPTDITRPSFEDSGSEWKGGCPGA